MDEGAARPLRDGHHPATGPVAGPGPGGGWREEVAFLRRRLIVAGVVVLLPFLWTIRGALLPAAP